MGRNLKLEIKIVGIIGEIASPATYLPEDFRTQKKLPSAINADFIWTYSNGQGVIGNYSELLRP